LRCLGKQFARRLVRIGAGRALEGDGLRRIGFGGGGEPTMMSCASFG